MGKSSTTAVETGPAVRNEKWIQSKLMRWIQRGTEKLGAHPSPLRLGSCTTLPRCGFPNSNQRSAATLRPRAADHRHFLTASLPLPCCSGCIIISSEHLNSQAMKTSAKQLQPEIDIRDIVAGHVRRLRIEANLTQQVLADSCNIYRTYLSRLESGDANPTIKVLAALAKKLDVEPGEFFKT